MTLKEKMLETHPEYNKFFLSGSSCGCPSQYDFLNTSESFKDDCPSNDCTTCWSREYKEEPDARD